MNLKTKYILFISLLHALFIVFAIFVFFENTLMFVICEAVIIISLLLFIYFYRAIFRPLKLLNAGIDLMSDKDFSIKFLPVGQPELDKLIDVFNKMIDQLRLERVKTTEKNFFLEKLIEASPTAIIIMDKKEEILSLNPASKKVFSLQDKPQLPNSIEELPSPWNIELLKLKDNTSGVIELNGINKYKCYKSNFVDRGVKQPFFIIEELTRELIKVERQSYEKVIRMMSHEVNNCVGAVNSIIDTTVSSLKKHDYPENEENIEVLNVARDRIINLNHFTKRFADIVKIPPPLITECDIKEMIIQLLIYFHADFEEKRIQVESNFKGNTNLNFDYQQLELVIINIIKNALQAIESEGRITINYNHSPQYLIIENNGEPIPEEIQKKLFEPFFTTKRTGQGIGLTLIKEILSNHYCDFSLNTRADGVTEFKIIFQK